MNSSVLAISQLTAQGSIEKNKQFEYFLDTFEGGVFNFSWASTRKSCIIIFYTIFLIIFWDKIGYHSNLSKRKISFIG